jgi:hypothetical protein
MNLLLLFGGFKPEEVFGNYISADAAELLLVFGTIVVSMAIMVWLGNWWSR